MMSIDYQSAAGMLERAGWVSGGVYESLSYQSVVWENCDRAARVLSAPLRVSPATGLYNSYWNDVCNCHNWDMMMRCGVEEFVNFAAAMELCS